jgi:hypothetical protein
VTPDPRSAKPRSADEPQHDEDDAADDQLMRALLDDGCVSR